jgi:transcriptional regulator with XRE-family HTH domain
MVETPVTDTLPASHVEAKAMPLTPFAKRLKALRREAGWSQQTLAVSAGLSTSTIHDLEQGRGEPSWTTLLALSDALGCSLDRFRDPPLYRPWPKPKAPKRKTKRRRK